MVQPLRKFRKRTTIQKVLQGTFNIHSTVERSELKMLHNTYKDLMSNTHGIDNVLSLYELYK